MLNKHGMRTPVGLDWLRRQGPMAQYCEHGNELLDFMKDNNLIFSDYEL
jgi:hypothetical protein